MICPLCETTMRNVTQANVLPDASLHALLLAGSAQQATLQIQCSGNLYFFNFL